MRNYLIHSILFLCFAIAAPLMAGDIIAPGAKLLKIATGFAFTEGPAANSKGDVYFTDQPNDRILIWTTQNELKTFMMPCGRANGLCFDQKDNLWACADEQNQLWIIDPDKNVQVIIKDLQGKLLNGPNDLWITPRGGVYFSDPYYKRSYWRRDQEKLEVQGVYYLTPHQKKVALVIDDLVQPNGLIGTPDGKKLYVTDIGDSKTYSYSIGKNGQLKDKKLFCTMGSDGLTLDELGNVYLTNRQGVTVFNADGEQIEQIATGAGWTANVCFGGKDGRTLFVTAMDGLYAMRMNVKGAGSQ
ncbi:SMP-30/gluconolactonase/LRE family protein [candidate division KSB1 bacterium]|nr:SMP-30/gluconolactonase/LRE family protein [candidate division KSB1 bacterium]